MAGQRFGKLLVIKYVERPSNVLRHDIYWLCKCDCGNEKEIRSNHLTMGKIITCGECPIFELPGKKLGKLTVIEFIESERGNGICRRFRCTCDCGKEVNFNTYQLLTEKLQSCGRCIDKQWKIGVKFGYLHVVSFHKVSGVSSDTYWSCKCDCGRMKVVSRNRLTTGHTQSCGCKRLKEGNTRGEKHCHHILTEKNIIEMRKIWAEELIERKATGERKINYSLQDLADKYGVSYGTIFKAVNSRTWFFLPPVNHYISEFDRTKLHSRLAQR